MKKIIIDNIKTTSLKNITNDDYIGIQWVGSEKGWIVELDTDKYISLKAGDNYIANCWETISKKAYVLKALEQDDEIEAFVFDNWLELNQWLKAK
jgi:hypothetical protein